MRVRPAFGRRSIPGASTRPSSRARYATRTGGRSTAPSGSSPSATRLLLHRCQGARGPRALAPVLETLDSGGVAREDVAALAVFRVQSARGDLERARAALRRPGAAVITESYGRDLDSVLGTPLAGTVGLDRPRRTNTSASWSHGRFASPNLLSAKASVHGAFARNAAGELRVQRTEEVPFTMFLPRATAGARHAGGHCAARSGRRTQRSAGARQRARVIGLRGDRARCAVSRSAFRAGRSHEPVHGRRDAGRLRRRAGDFIGADASAEGGFAALHPFYYRDAVQAGRGGPDAVRLLARSGRLVGSSRAAEPALEGVELETARDRIRRLGPRCRHGRDPAARWSRARRRWCWPSRRARRSMAGRKPGAGAPLLTQAVLDGSGSTEDERDQALLGPSVDAWRALVDRAQRARRTRRRCAPARRRAAADGARRRGRAQLRDRSARAGARGGHGRRRAAIRARAGRREAANRASSAQRQLRHRGRRGHARALRARSGDAHDARSYAAEAWATSIRWTRRSPRSRAGSRCDNPIAETLRAGRVLLRVAPRLPGVASAACAASVMAPCCRCP